MKRFIFAVAATLAFAVAPLAFAAEPAPTAAPVPDDLGQDVYNARCATCHGRDGKAKTPIGVKLKTRDLTEGAAWKARTDAAIAKVIDEGTADKAMPAYRGKFSAEETAALLKYLRGFQPKGSQAP